ncbi:unnamed protein product, partial [Discosporangium mesarthrocarpum]
KHHDPRPTPHTTHHQGSMQSRCLSRRERLNVSISWNINWWCRFVRIQNECAASGVHTRSPERQRVWQRILRGEVLGGEEVEGPEQRGVSGEGDVVPAGVL